MSTISKPLLGILFSGAALALASAPWKDKVRAIYGFNPAGTGYTVFKPGNTFNSLTQLVPDGCYILDVAEPGFELPGATLTAAAVLSLDKFSHNFYSGYDNITLQVSSPEATDREYLLSFDSVGAYSYKLPLGDTISLSVPNLTAGQTVTLTAVAPSGARLVHPFIVSEQALA